MVVQGNNNARAEFPADQVKEVLYDSSEDLPATRPVIFRVVKGDGKPFEKKVSVATNDGPDDVLVDTSRTIGDESAATAAAKE